MTDLPALISRFVDPRRPLTIAFGTVTGGAAANAIPTSAHLSGTSRTLDPEVRHRVPELIARTATELAALYGAKIDVDYETGIAPVVNHPGVISVARNAVADTLGVDAITEAATSMGAEDFAAYVDRIPGALLRLGVRADGHSTVALHSAHFVLDEAAIELGIAVGAETAMGLLAALRRHEL